MVSSDRLIEDLKEMFRRMEAKAPTRHSLRTDECLTDVQLVAIASGEQETPPDKREHVRGCAFCQRFSTMEFLPEEKVLAAMNPPEPLWTRVFRVAKATAQQISEFSRNIETTLSTFEPTVLAPLAGVLSDETPPRHIHHGLIGAEPDGRGDLDITVYSGDRARELYERHKFTWSDQPKKDFCVVELAFKRVIKEPALLFDEHDLTEYLQFEDEIGPEEQRCYLILDGIAEFQGAIVPYDLDETLVVRMERSVESARNRVLVACFDPDTLSFAYRFASRKDLADSAAFLRTQKIETAWWRDQSTHKAHLASQKAWTPDRIDHVIAEIHS